MIESLEPQQYVLISNPMLEELIVSVSKKPPQHGWNVDPDHPRGRYLYLGSPGDTTISHSLNINGGHLILGTNASRELTTLELGMSRAFWRHAGPELPRPQPTIQGTLALPNLSVRSHEYDDINPAVYSDDLNTFVNILVDATSALGPLWARICDRCLINIRDGHLMAFWIDLISPAHPLPSSPK